MGDLHPPPRFNLLCLILIQNVVVFFLSKGEVQPASVSFPVAQVFIDGKHSWYVNNFTKNSYLIRFMKLGWILLRKIVFLSNLQQTKI